MPKVLTRCPNTSAVVPTRLVIDAGSFRSIAVSGHSLDCPACGQTHVWEQGLAWVEGQPEADGLRETGFTFPVRPPRRRPDRTLPDSFEALWSRGLGRAE